MQKLPIPKNEESPLTQRIQTIGKFQPDVSYQTLFNSMEEGFAYCELIIYLLYSNHANC